MNDFSLANHNLNFCSLVPGRHCAVQTPGQSWRVTQLKMIRIILLVLLSLSYLALSSLTRDERRTNSQKIQSLLGDYNDFNIDQPVSPSTHDQSLS